MGNKQFAAGELIFVQGEKDNKYYKLEKGKVVLYLAFQSIVMLDIIKTAQFIGFAPLTSQRHLFTAEAIEDSEMDIEEDSSEELFKNHKALLNQLTTKINALLSQQEDAMGKKQLIVQMEKMDKFSESFFTRFFPYTLVRELTSYLSETGQIKKIEKGRYQKVFDSFNFEEGW